jgi:hypothetical protein
MKKTILVMLILALTLCGCSGSGGPQNAIESGVSQSGEAEESAAADDRAYTLDMYLQIDMGCTYEEVTAITGSSGEASVDGDVVKQYIWQNEDGSNISVTFTDGEANAKTQAYLGPFLRGGDKVTKKMFEQLNEGSSLAEVEEILGPGTEMMRQILSGEECVTYTWSNSDGSGITIVFISGKADDINDLMLEE